MSQIFHPTANAFARTTIVLVVVLIGGAGYGLSLLNRSAFITDAFVAKDQPVQFSHAHHVGDVGLDCRYCHTSVEQAGFANVPPTKTCMNCHSQLFVDSPYLEPVRASFRSGESLHWVRVHDLPDYVYFDHSIHVSKGVGCATCHGRVDKMPLMYKVASLKMEWCLECHRAPERFLRPREAVFDMQWAPEGDQLELGLRLKSEYRVRDAAALTSCSTCHR